MSSVHEITQRSDDEIRAAWRAASVRPLWETDTHVNRARPSLHNWSWSVMQPLAMEALALTSPAVSERRVLSLVDPTLGDEQRYTVPNINAGLQMLAPGEVARPHRHSMHALRFILAGSGAVTRVDGQLADMHEGDLVITPGWAWHEHWHNGDEPIVWLDALDVHLHKHLRTDAYEMGPVHDLPATVPGSAFEVANMRPDVPASDSSPIFRYAAGDAVGLLSRMPAGPDGSRRLRYVNPFNGGPVMPTLDCYLVALDPGTSTVAFRTSANAVCAVVAGSGTTTADDAAVHWQTHDVFSIPGGTRFRHTADEPARLFVVTDREIYRRLGLLEEVHGA